MLHAKGVKFKGTDQLDYAAGIGMGSRKYELVELDFDGERKCQNR
jgi:uncharacterized Fe-S center protein